jgi:hypothetical protein
MENTPEIYTIKIPISQLKRLRDDPQFILILRLGRYLNQLMFCHQAYLEWKDDLTPAGIRQTHNASFFSCGVLYEAIKIIPELGKEFSNYRAFKGGFKMFNRDKDLNDLKRNVLNKLRNGTIFHVNADPITETLKHFDVRRLDLIASTSTRQGDAHFQLADDIALNYLTGEHSTPEEEIKHYKETLRKIMDVMTHFINYANELTAEYVERKYWKSDIRK